MDKGEAIKPVVLFLCTGNTARSQMAEAFLKQYAGERFEVYSAGYEPKAINPYTIKVMEEAGFDLSGQHAKGVGDFLGKVTIRFLIIVCDQAEKTCPRVFPGVITRLFWPFEDPAALSRTEAEKLAKFRAIRDQVDHRIQAWLQELD
ncbi:MAG: arsenate reductase ArsC [Desulfobaccales bacterium]